MTNRLLKYSEYKKAQSLWLQSQFFKYFKVEKDLEVFCMRRYSNYLELNNFDNSKVFELIPMVKESNIIELMDKIVND